jgi:hypothetical protein
MSLKISKDLDLPDEAVTQTFAILAKRGVGKTYTASVMVEEMLGNDLHVVVVDPIGVWWGLRSSANGKKEGLSIIVAGGEHGDVPLEANSGETIANLVVDRGLSLVIDLSLMRKGEQKRFMIDFAETLYHKNRTALHLVLDEADEFAPQRPMGDDARMLGAIEDLVRRGRARGIGVTLITQRPAVLNKNVLTQIEVLIAMRLTSPQDRSALNEWVKYHADTDSSEEMIETLPNLPVGTAWIWSPGWLDIFKKIAIRKRHTLDSSSTPKVGQVKVKATKVAPVDIEKLKEQLAATIEKAEGEDPKLLKRKIVELQRQLADQKPQVEVREVIKLPSGLKDRLVELNTTLHEVARQTEALVIATGPMVGSASDPSFAAPNIPKTAVTKGFGPAIPDGTRVNLHPAPYTKTPSHVNLPKAAVDQIKITGGAQRMLDVLGSRYPMTFTKSQLAALTKMSPRSGTYGTYISLLKSNGLIQITGQDVSLTDTGRGYVGDTSTSPQTTDEIIDMWRGNLTGGARRMFETLVSYYPSELTRDELGSETDMSPGSGTFGTYLSSLKRNGLIEVNGSNIKANDSLFALGGNR